MSASDEFDFPGAQLPDIAPLRESFANGKIEEELKALFGELFEGVAHDTFDASVLGTPHLGSFELVRRTVNHDGLVLLKGEREEAATRYLYRAWKSGDVQKRGLHFLRTYLQLLFPGQTEVKQLWHYKSAAYGQGFVLNEPRNPYWFHFLGSPGLKLDGSWKVGRSLALDADEPPYYKPATNDLFLTSRVEILLGLEELSRYSEGGRAATSGLIDIIRSVIPARLVPLFKFWLRYVIGVDISAGSHLLMEKRSAVRYPWCGRVLTEDPAHKWSLGIDGELVRLPQPFGTFRLGERRGGKSAWRLRNCRTESEFTVAKSPAEASAYRVPALGETGRKLDGGWRLSGRQLDAMSWKRGEKEVDLPQPVEASATHHEHIRIDYPETPRKLGSAWRLNGTWRLGDGRRLTHAWAGQVLNGFRISRQGVAAESAASLHAAAVCGASPARLPRRKTEAEGGDGVEHTWSLPLNGQWKLGGLSPPEFELTITRV